ncbi:MAG TPA: response regulator transcription factor [Candidatus Polarisedimenticolia bacterium]|nr:response regulator transcription factor [Candidatus Polarisedimenticolia bacterium]
MSRVAGALIAEDHPLVRKSLKALLERDGIPVLGEAADGEEALRLAQALRPETVVLDLQMPLLNGLEVARLLRRSLPETKSILLTMHAEAAYVAEALEAGVHGYVLKSQAADDLVAAIRRVGSGGVFVSPRIAPAPCPLDPAAPEEPASR